eukprot:350015-Chlamydomonas_euryale.AAC.8
MDSQCRGGRPRGPERRAEVRGSAAAPRSGSLRVPSAWAADVLSCDSAFKLRSRQVYAGYACAGPRGEPARGCEPTLSPGRRTADDARPAAARSRDILANDALRGVATTACERPHAEAHAHSIPPRSHTTPVDPEDHALSRCRDGCRLMTWVGKRPCEDVKEMRRHAQVTAL